VVAERAVVGGDDVLDLRRQQGARVDLGCPGGAEQERHAASGRQRLIGQGADAGHAQAAGDEQHVMRARIDQGPAKGPRTRAAHPAARAIHSVPLPVIRKWMVMVPASAFTVLRLNGRRRTSPE
jgi:hypothetical protein